MTILNPCGYHDQSWRRFHANSILFAEPILKLFSIHRWIISLKICRVNILFVCLPNSGVSNRNRTCIRDLGGPYSVHWTIETLMWYPRSDSNRHWMDFESIASTNWATRAYGADTGIRTQTWGILSPLPLPLRYIRLMMVEMPGFEPRTRTFTELELRLCRTYSLQNNFFAMLCYHYITSPCLVGRQRIELCSSG